ncbi:hypothetical protein FPQ18DRAFT_408542 [Pyronema domesticum]|nr:hypothetical protein FPQ18DRAFT_408542 [Pyronema domesticum]
MIPEEQRLNKKFGERSRRCMMVAYINGTTKQWRIWQQEDNLKQDVSLQLPMSSSMKKSINLRPACVTTTHGSHPYRYSRARYQALYELKKPQAAQVWKRLEHDYLYKFSKNVHDLREKLWSIKLEDYASGNLPKYDTPYEMLKSFGKPDTDENGNTLSYKPTIEHLRRFGCVAYKAIPPHQRSHPKFGPRGRRCMFVGYVNETDRHESMPAEEPEDIVSSRGSLTPGPSHRQSSLGPEKPRESPPRFGSTPPPAVVTIPARFDLDLHQMDVMTAFLGANVFYNVFKNNSTTLNFKPSRVDAGFFFLYAKDSTLRAAQDIFERAPHVVENDDSLE